MPHVGLVRQNASYIAWLRAAALGGATAAALIAMPFYPPLLVAAAALAVGALAVAAPSLAALLLVGVVSLPILAADFVVGALFLIIGFSATQYLGADRAKGFITIALAALAASLHAEWAIPVLAGYLLGAGPGAIAALLACLLIQFSGALLGQPFVGMVATGGVAPGVLSFVAAPDAALSFKWLASAITEANPSRVVSAIVSVKPVTLLVVQPLLWGFGAMLGGVFRRRHEGAARLTAVVGLAGVTVILAATSAIALNIFGSGVPLPKLGITMLVSASFAVVVGAMTEVFFSFKAPAQPAPIALGIDSHGVRAEDADVDELLRLIASAEDELASRHTTEKVVMLTDMKSFSAMTEEVGSMASAKLVQRQRDLLLPVIDRHGGHGKSTGGDGLVAAFETESDALAAAIEMQRELKGYFDSARVTERVSIRIGIARGEVVLDRGGRPFIGAALNLAARVMDLADGDRIITTTQIADAAGIAQTDRVDMGSYELKNIQMSVEVTEILW